MPRSAPDYAPPGMLPEKSDDDNIQTFWRSTFGCRTFGRGTFGVAPPYALSAERRTRPVPGTRDPGILSKIPSETGLGTPAALTYDDVYNSDRRSGMATGIPSAMTRHLSLCAARHGCPPPGRAFFGFRPTGRMRYVGLAGLWYTSTGGCRAGRPCSGVTSVNVPRCAYCPVTTVFTPTCANGCGGSPIGSRRPPQHVSPVPYGRPCLTFNDCPSRSACAARIGSPDGI